jgi:hypothetical protein
MRFSALAGRPFAQLARRCAKSARAPMAPALAGWAAVAASTGWLVGWVVVTGRLGRWQLLILAGRGTGEAEAARRGCGNSPDLDAGKVTPVTAWSGRPGD